MYVVNKFLELKLNAISDSDMVLRAVKGRVEKLANDCYPTKHDRMPRVPPKDRAANNFFNE